MLENTQAPLFVSATKNQCPIGETVGGENLAKAKIPVLSCEGACIRGEIARQAANIIARQPAFGRACHGELLTVPDSAIAKWVQGARQVILIDGCFLRCHGRILENMLGKDQLLQFDALSHYKKYTDIFDMEEVPEEERLTVAKDVADWVMRALMPAQGETCPLSGCGEKGGCCAEAHACQSENC